MPLIKKVLKNSRLSALIKWLQSLYYRVRYKKWFYAAWKSLLCLTIAYILFNLPDIIITILPNNQFGYQLSDILSTRIRLLLTGSFIVFYTLGIILRPLARGGKWFYILWTSLLAASAGSALAAGIIFTPEPEKKISSVIAGIILCSLVARWLPLGIVAVILVAATILHESVIPKPLTFGGMGFGLTEMLILFMLVIVLLRNGANRTLNFFRSPMTIPLILLYISVVLAMVVGYRYSIESTQNLIEFRQVYNTVRPMFHYMLFFAIAFGIHTEHEIRFILRTIIWASVVVAILMIVQYFIGSSGKSVFIGTEWASYVSSTLESTTSNQTESTVRSMPPGLAIVVTFFLVTTITAAYEGLRQSKLLIVTTAILGLGILLSFYRGFWLSSITSIFIIILLANNKVRKRIVIAVTVGFAISIFGIYLLGNLAPGSSGSNLGKIISERFSSLFDSEKTLSTGSLENRIRENKMAIEKIKKHPIFGIGAGPFIQYREVYLSWRNSHAFIGIPYMHNSYLELWLVYGILGVISFAWLSIVFLARSYLLFKRTQYPTRKYLSLAFFAAYIGFLQRSITQMHIVHDQFQMVTVALMWGIIEAMWQLENREPQHNQLNINQPNEYLLDKNLSIG